MPKRPNKSLEIGEIPNNLEESYQVIVPTEKTNSFRILDINIYMTIGNKHLRSSSKEIDRDKVTDILEKSIKLVEDVGL